MGKPRGLLPSRVGFPVSINERSGVTKEKG
jgi:hypothetical protein